MKENVDLTQNQVFSRRSLLERFIEGLRKYPWDGDGLENQFKRHAMALGSREDRKWDIENCEVLNCTRCQRCGIKVTPWSFNYKYWTCNKCAEAIPKDSYNWRWGMIPTPPVYITL